MLFKKSVLCWTGIDVSNCKTVLDSVLHCPVLSRASLAVIVSIIVAVIVTVNHWQSLTNDIFIINGDVRSLVSLLSVRSLQSQAVRYKLGKSQTSVGVNIIGKEIFLLDKSMNHWWNKTLWLRRILIEINKKTEPNRQSDDNWRPEEVLRRQ